MMSSVGLEHEPGWVLTPPPVSPPELASLPNPPPLSLFELEQAAIRHPAEITPTATTTAIACRLEKFMMHPRGEKRGWNLPAEASVIKRGLRKNSRRKRGAKLCGVGVRKVLPNAELACSPGRARVHGRRLGPAAPVRND